MTAFNLRAIPKANSFKSAIITACSIGTGYLRVPILADSMLTAVQAFHQSHGDKFEVVHVLSLEETEGFIEHIIASIGAPYVPSYAALGIRRNEDGSVPEITSDMLLSTTLSLLATTGEDVKAALKDAFRRHPSYFYFCVMSIDELKDDVIKMKELMQEFV